MTVYAAHVSTRATPQSEAIPGKTMVKNSAGGFAFQIDDWKRLDRFLVLGCESPTYYATAKALTVENAACVLRCSSEDYKRTVDTIVAVSHEGRAPKNDPAIFALAIVAGQKGDAGRYALDALPRVARIGTHLFQFAESVKAFRGWGRSLRRAIGQWYTNREPQDLAYQLVKYQNRNGWSHRDLLRLAHWKSPGELHNKIMRWAVGKQPESELLGIDPLAPIIGFEHSKKATTKAEVCRLIREFNLPRECVMTQWLKEPDVWDALLEKMPLGAMVRNLGKMSSIGLLKPMSEAVSRVTNALGDEEKIKKARLHPMAILLSQKTYARGRGDKGSLSWTPVPQVVDALDAAFYKAFKAVDPTNKRTLLALDISGSMSSVINGTSLSAHEASCAMALVTANVEKQYQFVAFTSGGYRSAASGVGQWARMGIGNGITPLSFSPRQRLADVCTQTQALPMGGTDCSLPMLWAMDQKIAVDTFCVYTDNETWHGTVHPCQALVKYREKTGINAKLIVVGMTSTGFSIADPKDGGMLDVVGFDTAAPQVMSDFAR